MAARALVRGGGRVAVPGATIRSTRIGNEDKVEALRRLDKLLRAADPRVQQVMVSLSGGVDTVLVARSDGVLAADVRPLVRINVQVIVEQNGRRESGYAGGGGRYSYAELFADGKPETWAREALRQALVNLEAIDAPAGVDAGGARQRLARRAAARSGRPWPGRRLQPQGHLDLCRTHRPARRVAGRHHRRRRHAAKAAAARSTSTTKARRPTARR